MLRPIDRTISLDVIMFKPVKLDRRHKAFSWGYTYAIRFNLWDWQSRKIETYLSKIYPETEWEAQYRSKWYGDFRSKRTYWIYFRDGADLTLVLLSGCIERP
jgi:hypothetical protein